MRSIISVAVVCILGVAQASAQEHAKVDFARDVQPLFNAHCIECHGPHQQKNGFRLDRRRDALRGGTSRMIGKSSAASRLYLKLVSDRYGPQMPPDGPLDREEIDIIKTWIDQGAIWPDELAGEMPSKPADPKATRLIDALSNGDVSEFQTLLREDPDVVKRIGPGGSTPLMYAVLYGDTGSVSRLLSAGADPNVRNDAGATALMWAVDDLEKTRLLIRAQADVNARSEDGRTPLLIATGYFGASEVVKLLLEKGADPSVKAPSYRGPVTPLRQAADRGDDVVLEMLLNHGADAKAAGPFPLMGALNAQSTRCLDLLTPTTDAAAFRPALSFIAPPFGEAHAFGDSRMVAMLLDRGADVNFRDRMGHTVLMLASHLDLFPADVARMLLDHGANVNATMPDGKTALDFARQQGQTPLVDLLIKSGAVGENISAAQSVSASRPNSPDTALKRTIPLLQRVDVSFLEKTGCVSCHHNSLTSMTIASARKHGVESDDRIHQMQLKNVVSYIENWRERALQGIGIPGESNTVNYILTGMAAASYPPDQSTAALARFLKNQQSPDGRWRLVANRPPLSSSEIQVTAFAMRALQIYAPKPHRVTYEQAVRRATNWLRQQQTKTTTDLAFQIIGLAWAGGNEELIKSDVLKLKAQQRSDGGWAQLPTLYSDAYATGQALYALHEGGGVAIDDPAYTRGIQFLLNTQLDDGSWHVKSRAIPFQPYFESGFPHGPDQWISAAATNWAALALIPAAH